MIPYTNAIWHWFGRGQLYLLALNEQAKHQWTPTLDQLGEQWLKSPMVTASIGKMINEQGDN